MGNKKHYYDKIGICLNCDQCDVEECCEQSEFCDGKNWNFLDWTKEEWENVRKSSFFSSKLGKTEKT